MPDLKQTEASYPYLRVQKGQLDHIEDRTLFWAAYLALTRNQFSEIQPHLPPTCKAILDIGGGMGGIDVLVHRHYSATQDVNVYILDGDDDQPKVELHRQTFSNRSVSEEFLITNGIERPRFIKPKDVPEVQSRGLVAGYFDLILSFNAWCFHLPPSQYLEFVDSCLSVRGVLIVDLRKNRAHWLPDLVQRFGKPVVLSETAKSQRMVFRRCA